MSSATHETANTVPKTLLRAAWVARMSGPPIREGAVVFAGDTLLDVGPAKLLVSRHPDALALDRGHCTILPGLVNAHTHLELSEFSCGPKPQNFSQWLMRLAPRAEVSLDDIHASVARSVPIGIRQCLRFGVTSVGDISRHCQVTRPLLRNGPLRVVSYGEVQAMARRRRLLEERLDIAADSANRSSWLRIGLTPHAPYSVEVDGYRRCLEVARAQGLPLATHLAESPDEAIFLERHIGPLRELWDYLDAWDDDVPKFAGGPVRMAYAIGLLGYPVLLAHVNHCDDAELELLAGAKASVVYCPRTHGYFSHPRHRWRQMLARGINVAIGTDSCASSPDLNLVDDLRLLRQIAPDVPAEQLWQLATARAARAIQMSDRVGSLEAGKLADFVAFETETPRPLEEILDSQTLPREVWIGGRQYPLP